MTVKVELNSVYVPSNDVVAREIEGEIIIVPVSAGVVNIEDELYSLNDTARAIWKELDGTKPLSTVVKTLAASYEINPAEIERDVVGLVGELLERRILVEAGR